MSYCTNCGKQLVEGGAFCQSCGSNVSSTQATIQPNNYDIVTNADLEVFIGKNKEKYLAKFANFNKGSFDSFSATWHWPSLFIPFWWLMYRKMYIWALLAFAIGLIPYAGLASGIGWAVVSNYLYYCHAKKKIREIKSQNQNLEVQKVVIANAGGVGNAIVIVMAIFTFTAVVGIIAAIAIPQFSAYRTKGYDSAARSDARNAQTACETFYADNKKYPNSLGDTGYKASQNVEIEYKKLDDKHYVLLTKHKSSKSTFEASSDTNEILKSE